MTFWDDKSCKNIPLRVLFPKIYDLVLDRNVRV